MGLRPSVTHIKRTGHAAAFGVPGMEEDQKGRGDPCEAEELYSILVNLGPLNFNLRFLAVKARCIHQEGGAELLLIQVPWFLHMDTLVLKYGSFVGMF